MNRAIAILVLVAVLFGVGFATGYAVRDGRADAATATHEAAQQSQRADVAEAARATDHANAQAAAAVEAQRIERSAERAQTFDTLKTEAAAYALRPANPAADPDRFDADFLRTWDAANAAAYQRTGHRDPVRVPGGAVGTADQDGRR